MINSLELISLNLDMIQSYQVLNSNTHPQNLLTVFWDFAKQYPENMLNLIKKLDPYLKNEQLEEKLNKKQKNQL
jgi:hypothetical protein